MHALGFSFKTEHPEVSETDYLERDPQLRSMILAEAKSRAVARHHPGDVVIGSDQVGSVDGDLLEKPGTPSRAISQLKQCSGKIATFYTSVCVTAPTFVAPSVCVTTQLQFRALTEHEISRYVEHDNPVDCAGAFKIERAGLLLFDRVRSDDPSALIGLPVIATLSLLRKAGFDPLRTLSA